MTKAYFKTRIEEVCNNHVSDSSQAAKEMSPKDASRKDRTAIEQVKLQLVFLLEDIVESGLLKHDADGVNAGVLNEQILKISSREQIKDCGQILSKSLDDSQYLYKLLASESIRGGIKQVLDIRTRGLANSKELISKFVALNPKDSRNIDVYYEIAQKAAGVLQSTKASEGDINAVTEFLAQGNKDPELHAASGIDNAHGK